MKKEKKWEREADKYKKADATFADKLANFWDYHKFHLLVGIVVIIGVVYLSTSIYMKPKYDYTVIFVMQNPVLSQENGDYLGLVEDGDSAPENTDSDGEDTDEEESSRKDYIYKEDVDYICKFLESSGEDLNGDGKVTVNINCINIEGDRTTVNEIQSHKEQILTALRTGDCMLLISDITGTEFLTEAEALEDISELSDKTEFNGTVLPLNGYFKEKIGKAKDDIPIYISLRVFTGTMAQMSEEKKNDFENARNLIENIISR